MFDEAAKEAALVATLRDNAMPPKEDTKERHAMEQEIVHEFVSDLVPRNGRARVYLLVVSYGMRRGET